MEACSVGTGIWLAHWSSAKVTTNQQRDFYLTVYGSIGAGQSFFIFMYSLTLFWGAIKASRTLHRKLIVNILRLPMTFFDTTPLGRIMNRLSKDIYGIDVTIPLSLRSFLQMFFDVLGMLVAVSYATPLFLSILPPLAALYFYFQVGENMIKNLSSARQAVCTQTTQVQYTYACKISVPSTSKTVSSHRDVDHLLHVAFKYKCYLLNTKDYSPEVLSWVPRSINIDHAFLVGLPS